MLQLRFEVSSRIPSDQGSDFSTKLPVPSRNIEFALRFLILSQNHLTPIDIPSFQLKLPEHQNLLILVRIMPLL